MMHIETECDIDNGDKNDTFNNLWFSYFTLNCFKKTWLLKHILNLMGLDFAG